jgi:hypothetical protein
MTLALIRLESQLLRLQLARTRVGKIDLPPTPLHMP